MTKIRLAALVAAIAAAAMSIGSAGAGTGTSAQTVDLSTDQAVVSYLTSLGIDPAGVVIQRGASNYAGPSCPGAGWTCTTSTKVVQVGQPGGQNVVACGAGADLIPDSDLAATTLTPNQVAQLVTAAAQARPVSTCVAVQAGAQTNSARCVKRDSDPTAVQECNITQPGSEGTASASNRAFVLEMIDQSTTGTQDGTQRSKILQTAIGDSSNFAHVIQFVKQSTNADGAQGQEGHQVACTGQISVTGNEFAQTIQSVAQKARSSSQTPAQTQEVAIRPETCDQVSGNTAFLTSDAHTFARVEQDSGNGALESHVNQSHNLDARATNATAGSQTQGVPPATPPEGGIQGKVFQDSTGVARSFGLQNEDQSLVGNSPTITQKQFGPLTCCATQTGNNNDNAQIDQMSAQRAGTSTAPLNDLVPLAPNPSALQETLLQGNFETSGDGDITHKAKQNGGSDTATCPPGEITDTETGTTACTLTTFGLNGTFFAEFPPPICSEGEFFDPETGMCEEIPD
jgi:hypothetical protein